MNFSRKKIPGEQSNLMRVCPIESMHAYFPVPGPVYILLSGNGKFVAVKGPLDFFTDEELARLKPVGSLFYPGFIKRVLPFRREALQFRSLLLSVETAKKGTNDDLANIPSPYELSDAFLRMAGNLWSDGGVVEPFFTAVFAHELCDRMSPSWMLTGREKSVEVYEQAILRSGWAVWQAMHLGYLNVVWLTQLRNSVYRVAAGLLNHQPEILKLLPEQWMRDEAMREIPLTGLGVARTIAGVEREKLFSRAERLRTELIQERDTFRSIFGPGGFRDG